MARHPGPRPSHTHTCARTCAHTHTHKHACTHAQTLHTHTHARTHIVYGKLQGLNQAVITFSPRAPFSPRSPWRPCGRGKVSSQQPTPASLCSACGARGQDGGEELSPAESPLHSGLGAFRVHISSGGWSPAWMTQVLPPTPGHTLVPELSRPSAGTWPQRQTPLLPRACGPL